MYLLKQQGILLCDRSGPSSSHCVCVCVNNDGGNRARLCDVGHLMPGTTLQLLGGLFPFFFSSSSYSFSFAYTTCQTTTVTGAELSFKRWNCLLSIKQQRMLLLRHHRHHRLLLPLLPRYCSNNGSSPGRCSRRYHRPVQEKK